MARGRKRARAAGAQQARGWFSAAARGGGAAGGAADEGAKGGAPRAAAKADEETRGESGFSLLQQPRVKKRVKRLEHLDTHVGGKPLGQGRVREHVHNSSNMPTSTTKNKMKSKRMNKNSNSSSIHHHHFVKTSTPSSANTFPFPTDESDHCETPKEAFQDLAALLDAVATKLQKSRADLKIYDPYYCAGRSARTLGLLGFDNVYNRCEDFYKMIETSSTPEFDVVVTNPPFSGDHMERIIQWAASTGKPFFLLMPNFVYTKPYYAGACGDKQPRLLVPLARGRYKFLPPAWVSAAEGSTSIAKGKTATSPFLAFWYCWAENIDAAGASCGSLHVVLTPPRREEDFYKNQGLLLCAGPDALPQEVRGELDTARKRPSPKIRKKIAQLRQTMRTAFSR